MRSKITYIVAVLVQVVILFLLINSEISVFKSPERLVSETKMIELQRFTDSQTIHLSYPLNTLSSMEYKFEAGKYEKNHPVYVKIQMTDAGVKPVFFSAEKPELADGEVLLKGKVESASSEKLYMIKYEAKGKRYEAKWMGNLRSVKKGDAVMLALNPVNPAKIEFISEWKEYQTRTPGKIIRINQTVMNGQRVNDLTIEFQRDNQKLTGQYTQFLADMKQPVVLGAPVEVSFDAATNKILYVEFNPLVKAVISEIETGYTIQARYGIETYNLQKDQKAQLNELIDRFGESQVSVEFAASKSGNAALTGILISGQKVTLN